MLWVTFEDLLTSPILACSAAWFSALCSSCVSSVVGDGQSGMLTSLYSAVSGFLTLPQQEVELDREEQLVQ